MKQPAKPPRTADALGEVALPDHEGREVHLRDLWRDRPAALVWLRHYGWVHCRDHAVQLHRARSEFEAAGVDLVLIGQATPRHAAHFRRRMDVDLPVLADAERKTYRLAGAKVATVGELLGPRSVARGIGRTARSRGRIRQGRIIGDAAQLGGALLVMPDGRVAWSHMSKDASDNATPEEIVAAARSALAEGG